MKVLSSLLKAGLLGTVLLFFMMYAMGGALTWGVHGHRGLSSFATDHSNWPIARGYVMAQSTNPDGLVFVTFVYGVGGRPWTGTQYWSGDGPIYTRGDPVTVYYDDDKPSISVVDASKRQAPMFDLLTQPAIMAVSFVAYGAVVIWAWASCCAALVSMCGRTRPSWSWRPRGKRIWRIAGTAFPMAAALYFGANMAASGHLSSATPVLVGAFAAYVLVPLALMLLLRFNNFFSGWMGSLGGKTQGSALAVPMGSF